MQQFFDISSILEQYKFSKNRKSKDSVVNNEGNQLLDICKSNNLIILNGRCGQDKETGAYTFKGISVIDYTIASTEVLKYIDCFEVRTLDPIFSDGHALLSTTLQLKNKQYQIPKANKHPKGSQRPKWSANKSAQFSTNINNEQVNDIKTYIENARHDMVNVNKETMNNICGKIADIFTQAAGKSFGDQNGVKDFTDSKDSKRRFGYNCRSARRKYHIARKINNINPSETNKNNLQTASKTYKRTMNKYINKHKKQMQQKLRNLKHKNPKEFWKILNNIERKEDDPDISIDTLYEYFKNLNINNDGNDTQETINIDITDDDEILNSSITEGEIIKCIKSLKNNKSSANDRIINEYIKNSTNVMIPIYVSYFNLIFDTGHIPDAWLEGIVRPIYKRTGSPDEPENYRPITILSCFGKLFTAIINQRLHTFLESNGILEENQAGFRSGYSTTDHIFTLHALTEILKSRNKKLFCAYIDFQKAFDSVWRIGLWMKLLGNSINGKCFKIIYNLYQNIKSCIKYSGKQSSFFLSHRGVRQGENLSPVLFCLFLNDLEDYLRNNNYTGITLDLPENDVDMFLKIFVLLYADDTVIFGTDEHTFQENLKTFNDYCNLWKLNVNFNKTKVMIFGFRNTDNFQFYIGPNAISICDEYKYLGVMFTKTRSFYKAIKHNVEQAKKALHLLYKRINSLQIPIDLQLQIFDHTILPILLYGCEVWGFQNTDLIEKVHNQFLRNITKTRKSTPLYMLYAELGRSPINLQIKKRMLGYWISILNGSDAKIVKKMYQILYNDFVNRGINHKWIGKIRQILISVGKPDLLHQHNIQHPLATKLKISQTLHDIFLQDWNATTNTTSKGRNYKLFKMNINFETFLISLPRSSSIPMVKFRTANHKLPIEVGR